MSVRMKFSNSFSVGSLTNTGKPETMDMRARNGAPMMPESNASFNCRMGPCQRQFS